MLRTVLALILFTPLAAFAHPGEHHDTLFATLWHLLSEPDHLLMLAFAVLAGISLARLMRRKASGAQHYGE